jgi:hypothetical protein
MDENTVRSLLRRLADSDGPQSSVDVGKARRAGLRRLRLRRIGAPAASLSAIAIVAGLVASGAMPFGLGFSTGHQAQATVRLTDAEVAVLTNSGRHPRALAQINNAFEVLVQRCMKSKGLKYYPSFNTAADEKGSLGLAGVPQATIGLAARRANGYGFSTQAVRARKHPRGGPGLGREEKYADSAGKKYVLALNGSEIDRKQPLLLGKRSVSMLTGGCRGSAERRIYGSAGNYLLATTGSALLTDALLNAVTADPAFAAVVDKWAACMADRGFNYINPENLWNSLAGKIDTRKRTPALRDLEIRVSLADYRCAKAVALLPTVRALQAHHARYYSQALAGYLAKLTRIQARALKVAKGLHLHLPSKR